MFIKRVLVLGACLITASLGACAPSAQNGGAVPEPVIEAPDMSVYWATHAANVVSGDVEAATGILAEDCVLVEPFQPPTEGLQNIVPKFEQSLAAVDIHDMSIDSQEAYHQGTHLVDFGTYSETFSLKGSEDRYVLEGSYAAVLERGANGDWKVKRFMQTPSKPFPPELTGTTPEAPGEEGL